MNRIAAGACLLLIAASPVLAREPAPQVLTSVPANGANDVPLDVGRLVVVFDRDMDTGSTGIAAAPDAPRPPLDGLPTFLDPRTLKIPLIKLAEGTRYALLLSDGFRSADGVALDPVVLSFTVAGASPETPTPPEAPSLLGAWSGSCGSGKLAISFDADGGYRFELRAGGVESSTGRYRVEGDEVVLEEEGLDAVRSTLRFHDADGVEFTLYGAMYDLRRVGAAPAARVEKPAPPPTGFAGVWRGRILQERGEGLSVRKEWSEILLDIRSGGDMELWMLAPDGTERVTGTYVLGEEREGAYGRRALTLSSRTRAITHRMSATSLGILDLEWLGWMRFARTSDPPAKGDSALADWATFLPGTWAWRHRSHRWTLSFAADGTGQISMGDGEEKNERPIRWTTGPGYVTLDLEGIAEELQFDVRLREEDGVTRLELSQEGTATDLDRCTDATRHGVPLYFGGRANDRLDRDGLEGLWVEEGPTPGFRLDIEVLSGAAEAEIPAADGTVRRVRGAWEDEEEGSAFRLDPEGGGEPVVGDYHALSPRLVEFAVGDRIYRCRRVREPRHPAVGKEAPEVGEGLRRRILDCLADRDKWDQAFDDSTLAGYVTRGREVWETLKVDGFEYVTTNICMSNWRQYPIVIVEHVATGLEFSLVPGGRIVVGSESDTESAPPHEVSVAPFLACRTEVSQEAWDRIGGVDARPFRAAALPITGVTWSAARDWCAKAGVRLPSEAEWEYLCRSGNDTTYCFGDEDPDRYAWSSSNSGDLPKDAGVLEENAFGLFDVHGNVAEWCEDEWHETYEGAPVDGSAWVDDGGSGAHRVVRGGSVADDLTPSSSREGRLCVPPDSSELRFVGLRPVVSLK